MTRDKPVKVNKKKNVTTGKQFRNFLLIFIGFIMGPKILHSKLENSHFIYLEKYLEDVLENLAVL